MRRARLTLRPGSIVWYPSCHHELPLIVTAVSYRPVGVLFICRDIWPGDDKGICWAFHNDWELVGFAPDLIAAATEDIT